ncbi:hypothetical protein NHX12_016811, partial [Muraenolepis orangiensis]
MRFCRREAHFHSDDDIRTLSREDFHEMLPGPGNLRQRKAVYELIHQQVHQQEPTQEANQGAVYHQYQLPAVGPSPGDVSGIKPAPHSRGVDPDESSRARDAQPAAEVQSSVTTQQTRAHAGSQPGSSLPPVPTGSKPDVGPSPGDVSGIKPAPHSRGVDPDESSRARDTQPAAEVQSSVTTQQT